MTEGLMVYAMPGTISRRCALKAVLTPDVASASA
jgi:hypothetical protein